MSCLTKHTKDSTAAEL